MLRDNSTEAKLGGKIDTEFDATLLEGESRPWNTFGGSLPNPEALSGSKFAHNEESLLQQARSASQDHLQSQALGSGMIGKPSFPDPSSSSSSINEYSNFLGMQGLAQNYPFYDPYHQQFLGHATHLHNQGFPVAVSSYQDVDQSYKTFGPGAEFADFASPAHESQKALDPKAITDKNYLSEHSILLPHSILSQESTPSNDSFGGPVSAGGMGGFVNASWGYEAHSNSLPLSMMHSPLRSQPLQQFSIPLQGSDSETSANHSTFMHQSFQLPHQFYSHPPLHEQTGLSGFPMNDQLNCFYTARLAPSAEAQNSETGHLESQSSVSIENSRKRSHFSLNGSSSSSSGLGSAASVKSARNSRGQIMVLRETGDMIPEADDDPEASYRGNLSNVPRRYMCNVCSKRFTRPSTLRTHMNSHTGERPYPCPSQGCEWKFTVLSNLKRHMRICTGVKQNDGDDDECDAWRA